MTGTRKARCTTLLLHYVNKAYGNKDRKKCRALRDTVKSKTKIVMQVFVGFSVSVITLRKLQLSLRKQASVKATRLTLKDNHESNNQRSLFVRTSF